jgi:CubicO group peptidase (beta-lactamase class C family)
VGTRKRKNPCNDLETFILGKKTLRKASDDCPGVRPIHAPGTQYDYSGGGYAVAESMLETETGQPFEHYMRNYLLSPAGMRFSTYGTASSGMPFLAKGCSRGKCKNAEVNPTDIKSAGGLLVHPAEYGELLYVVMNEGKDRDGKQVIEWADIKTVLTPERHRGSSMEGCKISSRCPSLPMMTDQCAGSLPLCTKSKQEVCLQGQCQMPITDKPAKWAADWYGQGVELSQVLHTDGLPVRASHGGADPAEGIRTEFFMRRDKRVGIFVVVNGEYQWEDKGTTRGGSLLAGQILQSFRNMYGI